MSRIPAFLGFAQEGWSRAAYPVVLAGLFFALRLPAAGSFFLAVAVAVLLFFRDPGRTASCGPEAFFSPADGRVVLVDRACGEGYPGGDALKISIFMNVFNVHINRSPVAGRVLSVDHRPGRFRFADKEGASLENERVEVLLETPSGEKVLVVQVAGFVARRVECKVKEGDVLERGERFGLICFGSRVDLHLPPAWKSSVLPGDRVRAGVSVLGVRP